MEFFTNKWVLAVYAVIAYNFYMLIKAKKDFDRDQSGFLDLNEIKHYFKVEMLPILFSVWMVPAGVFAMPAIWEYFIKGMEFPQAAYLASGCFSALIQWYIKKKSNGK